MKNIFYVKRMSDLFKPVFPRFKSCLQLCILFIRGQEELYLRINMPKLRRAILSLIFIVLAITLFITQPSYSNANLQGVIIDSAGDVGLHTSIDIDSNSNPHISYYDVTHGDLKYARKSGGTWIIETVDSPDDVGQYTAIAIDSNNNPHISYYDATHGDLKYATKSGGTWAIRTVDNSPFDVGLYTSIALDYLNNPYISYYNQDIEELKLAYKDPAWQIKRGPSARIIMSKSTSIVINQSFVNPIIAYFDANDRDLKLTMYDRAGVFSAPITDDQHWSRRQEIVTGSNTWMEDVSITLGRGSEPHLAYIDLTGLDADLKYAKKECDILENYPYLDCLNLNSVTEIQPTGQGTWNYETVDPSGASGESACIALDSNDNPHISYYNWELKYAVKSGGVWTIETVDNIGDVGHYSSIAIDSNDNPHISYYDATNGDLKYAHPMREKLCFPPHRGVPRDPDPPEIDGKVQEDVGWRGACRLTYGNGTSLPDVAFQALKDRTQQPYLYLSFEVRNDPTFDNDDVVVINFRKSASSGSSSDDRRIFIYPVCDNDGAAGQACDLVTPEDKINRPPRLIRVWKNSASWTELASGQPTNMEVKIRSHPDWSLYAWNIELKVPTNVGEGGPEWIDFSDDFLFYFNVIRASSLDNTASEFRWPRNAPEVGDNLDSYPFSPEEWGEGIKSDSARCKGVWVEWRDVGTENDPPHTIKFTTPINTITNTFFAHVKNDTEVGGTAQPANDVRVRFRIANWGIPALEDWSDILVPNPECPDPNFESNPTCPQNIPAATSPNPGTRTFNLKWKVPDSDIPNYQAHEHQCILVELDSLSDTNIVTKSVYRNMDFVVSASEFMRSAEISARGFGEPPAGLSEHQFTLHVTTQNQTEIPLKQEKAVIDEEEQLSRMTWIAHGYRRSGGFIVIQGHRYALVDPVGSFGYVVQHSGKVKEWKHELIDAEKIGPNLYKLLIRPDDVAVVTTRIEPKEYEKKWSVGIHSGAAVPTGSFNKNFDPGLNLLLGTYYQISPQFSLAAFFGYNDFKSKTAGVEDTYWINLSANMKYRLHTGTLSPYFSGGLGYYVPKTGSSGFGINLGVGLDYDYNNFITLELGADYHTIFDKDVQFLHSHAGVIFRF